MLDAQKTVGSGMSSAKPEPRHSQARRWEGATYALLTKEGRPCSTQDIRHGPREMPPKRPGSISLRPKAGGA